MKSQLRKVLFGVAVLAVVVAAGLATAQPAQAQWGPVWHPGSTHYHRVYHPTRVHWTPGRGWHTHGHYDYVPHRTQGHFDLYHNGHMHLNPNHHNNHPFGH